MAKCDRCGKGAQTGMNVSHSHVRTKKRSQVNIHLLTINKGSEKRRLHLCTKCQRIVKKENAPKAKEASKQEVVVETKSEVKESKSAKG